MMKIQCIYCEAGPEFWKGYRFDRLCGLVVRVPGYRCGDPRFDSRHYKKKVVGLERGPLSLVSTTEELLGRNSSGSGLESREYGRRDSIHKKLASGGHSVGIVSSWTQDMEFFF
jgi:hypothetical protein